MAVYGPSAYGAYGHKTKGGKSGVSQTFHPQPGEEFDDRLPQAAGRLHALRESLPSDAMRAYHALQLALKQHSNVHAGRPNFEKDFHDNLSMLFPDAYDICARQIGSFNQWEVKVDGGPSIFCSVRLEVMSDDANFLKELKEKTKIVKDTLLEDHGKWKRTLLPEHGAPSVDTLSMFESECARRSDLGPERGFGGKGGRCGGGGGNSWVEPKTSCQICGRSQEDDQLSGTHMCKVCATFVCVNCHYTWTSYHGRLRPDGELMGQQCSKCKDEGQAKDWRVVPEGERVQMADESGGKGRGARMHQSELCLACQQFGNCMGVFYDPFILTTALSLVSGQYVQWKSFSPDMPEFLIADLGPQNSGLKVCLQPHVYVAQSDELNQPTYHEGAGAMKGKRREKVSKGKGYPSGGSKAQSGPQDRAALERFIRKVDHQSQQPPKSAGPTEAASSAGQGDALAGDEAGGGGVVQSVGRFRQPGAQATPPSAGGVPRFKTANKIASSGKPTAAAAAPGGNSSAHPATPLLDNLQPLLRAQLLQAVSRVVKASGGSGSEVTKFALAEDFLTHCDGDFDRAYHFVKDMVGE